MERKKKEYYRKGWKGGLVVKSSLDPSSLKLWTNPAVSSSFYTASLRHLVTTSRILASWLCLLSYRSGELLSAERLPPHSHSKKQYGLTVEDARHVAYSKDIYQSNILENRNQHAISFSCCFYFYIFWERGSWCILGWSWTQNSRDLPASAFQVLGLKACATISWLVYFHLTNRVRDNTKCI